MFIHGRRSVIASSALRLAQFFNVSANFWMNLQMQRDMYHIEQEATAILKNRAYVFALNTERGTTACLGSFTNNSTCPTLAKAISGDALLTRLSVMSYFFDDFISAYCKGETLN